MPRSSSPPPDDKQESLVEQAEKLIKDFLDAIQDAFAPEPTLVPIPARGRRRR